MWFCRWIRSTNKQLVTRGVKTPSASLSYCVCASDGGRRKIISVSSGWSAWNKGQIKLMFCCCVFFLFMLILKRKRCSWYKAFLNFYLNVNFRSICTRLTVHRERSACFQTGEPSPHPPVSLLISNRSGVVLIDKCFPSWKNKWAECWDYKWGDVIALSFARAAHLATSVNDISAAIRVVAVDLLK